MLDLPRLDRSADVGVFGGSGFYELAHDLTPFDLETPYGPPSEPPLLGMIGGRTVAFLPRHGADHRIPAHRVNYRANVWAMAALGVKALVAPFACGSLRAELEPGHLVLVDQLVDRTSGREGTFFDGPVTFHLPFADPYDAELSATFADVARRQGRTVVEGGTVVVVQGPRFSTRAEADWHRRQGWDVVNMTQAPEAALAGEAGIRYVGIALVTDHDAGHEHDPTVAAVTQEDVFRFLAQNAQAMRELLAEALPRMDL